MTIKKRLARSNIAMLEIPVLVGNMCLGAWLVFAAVRRLTRRSRP